MKEFGVSIFPHEAVELKAVKPIIERRLLAAGNAVIAFEDEMRKSRERAMLIPDSEPRGLEKRIIALRHCDTMELRHEELIHRCEYLCELSCYAGLQAHYDPHTSSLGRIYYGDYSNGGAIF